MISAKQKKTLKKLLALGPQQDDTFTFDELMGYMFGIAITPSVILPSEWLPPIFAGQEPEYASLPQAQEMIDCLMQVYNTFNASFHTGQLSFPHDPMRNRAADLDPLIEWLFGFSEALAIRPDIWEPEDLSHLPEDQAAEIFSSLMTIQGLTNPQSFDEMVENLPEHFIHETLPKMSREKYDRKTQIQALLLAMLPAAIETLVEYGKLIEERRQRQPLRPTIPLPIRSAAKVDRNDPCPCNSGKKYKKGCGQSGQDRQSPLPAAPSGRRATIIQGNFPRKRPQETKAAPIYQLKISLTGAKPPIWRRIQVPGSVTLFQLHTIIQHCMGWNDYHLHQFIIDKAIYSLPDEEDGWYSNKPLDERRFSLHTLEKQLEPFFRYIYDFGDDWDHRITVEKILPPGEGSPKAVLLTGKRACPPEDSGGIYSYLEQLEILATPDHGDHQEVMDWLGEDFQPAQFGKEEIQAINAILAKIT